MRKKRQRRLPCRQMLSMALSSLNGGKPADAAKRHVRDCPHCRKALADAIPNDRTGETLFHKIVADELLGQALALHMLEETEED